MYKSVTKVECQKLVAYSYVYGLIWVTCLAASSLSCYMSVLFSREKQTTNRQFNMIFNQEDAENATEVFVQEQRDQWHKFRAARLKRFYD